jgi:alcohol dehydrogenase
MTERTMRAVMLTAFGDREGLVDLSAETPRPGVGEILIRNQAIGFNPIDYQIRQHGFEELQAPIILGFDVAGVVEDVGADVTNVRRGDEVMAWLGGPSVAGGYAEYSRAPAALAAPKPRCLSFAEAAAVPLAGLTALRSLQRAGCGPGRSVLVAGGAGGVGSWAVRLARALNCGRIVTTAGSAASRAYLRDELGLPDEQIVDYKERNRLELAAAAKSANRDRLYNSTIDCVGGKMTALCSDVVEFGGNVTVLVNAPAANSNAPTDACEEVLFARAASVHFELVFSEAEYATPPRLAGNSLDLHALSQMIDAGILALPRITQLGRLSAKAVQEAHRILEEGHARGKLVVAVE